MYVYDLSKGMARQFSALFLGKHFDGVWHTGVVAFGQEWFFGNDGISSCPPKTTILGEPNEIVSMGRTDLMEHDFLDIIHQLSESSFKIGTYNLLEHNCNNFSNQLTTILVGSSIPQHILDLPKEIMNTSLGPMLRPMLEQAADPMHQLRAGHTPISAMNFTRPAAAAATPKIKETAVSTTVILFKPDIEQDVDSLLAYFQSQNLEGYDLLVEIKKYLQKVETKDPISNKHVKLLFKSYLNHVNEATHMSTILKIMQSISLDKNLATLIVQDECFVEHFLPRVNKTDDLDLKHNSLQMLSNVCSHHSTSQQLLHEHQTTIFKEFSDYVLTEPNTDKEIGIQESSVSLFYNLISEYHLEDKLDDSNALTLGCALLERLPKQKLKPKSIYHMLSLLRSCLSKSEDMRNLAISMEFDLSKYHQIHADQVEIDLNNNDGKDGSSKQDSVELLVQNIDNILKK